MTQKECFKLFEKHFDQIKQEFLAHNIKAKLDQHDFSEEIYIYVQIGNMAGSVIDKKVQ